MPVTQKGNVLIQVKVPRDLYKALVERMTQAGDLSLAAYLRHTLTNHVREKVIHGKK
jgi:predicted solute-binding protein